MLKSSIEFEAPEKISFTYEIAPVSSRIIAVFIDFILQAALIVPLIILLLSFAAGYSFDAPAPRNMELILFGFVLLYLFFVEWIYFSLFEILLDGKTPGKKVMQIRVIRKNGEQADIPSLILRNMLRAVDDFPLFYFIGGIVAMISGKNQRIGDMIGGVIVIAETRPRKKIPDFSIHLPENAELPPVRIHAPLSEKELYIIRRFFREKGKMPGAEKIAAALVKKIGGRAVAADDGKVIPPEDFLLSVYRSHRNGH